jgi:hypothetical protein
VVVTGGRDYADAERVAWALDGLRSAYGLDRLAHGAAAGADTLAAEWAIRAKIGNLHPYPADWAGFARAGRKNGAGPARNRAMLEAERPDLVVAFPGGAGTADCCRTAEAMGLLVWRVAPAA